MEHKRDESKSAADVQSPWEAAVSFSGDGGVLEDTLEVGITPFENGLFHGLLDEKESLEADGKCALEGKKICWFVGGVPVRIDGETEASLVAPGGLDSGNIELQNHDKDIFGPAQELFPITINWETSMPTTEFLVVPVERNMIMDTGEDHFANAQRHFHYYEVPVSREELMFVRPGYGLPGSSELRNRVLEGALDGTRVAVHLTIPERETLNRMRTITGGVKVEDCRYDQDGNKVGPSLEERETVSCALERKIEDSLQTAAGKFDVAGLGLGGRTILGLYLQRLADYINSVKKFWGTDDPKRPGSRRPRAPPHWPYWTAYWYLHYQASYLSPAAIEARKYGYETLSDAVKEELEKLERWPRPNEMDFSAKTNILFVRK